MPGWVATKTVARSLCYDEDEIQGGCWTPILETLPLHAARSRVKPDDQTALNERRLRAVLNLRARTQG